MDDQARQLRELVRECVRAKLPAVPGRPRMVVLAGGKGGVGTTTLAVNLAAAAAGLGVRTALVDAAPSGGNAALLCGIAEAGHLGDVLGGRRRAADSLRRGGEGLSILPGMWGLENLVDFPLSAVDQLIEQLFDLGTQTSLVVVDAGNTAHRAAARFWQSADRVLVVSTPESASVLDAYAAIKLLGDGIAAPIFTLVNQVARREMAGDVHLRLAQACRRFLGRQIEAAGEVSADPLFAAWAERGIPLVQGAADSPPAGTIWRLAGWLTDTLAAYVPDAAIQGRKTA